MRHHVQRHRPNRRWLSHHLPFFLASSVLTALLSWLQVKTDLVTHLSVATASVGLLWLCLTLVLGPLNVLRRRPNPVSTDVRRDLGLWAALLCAFHSTLGTRSLFTWAIPVGGWAMLLILLLVVLSNDFALRWLKTKRWKQLQQLNYLVFVLAVVHTFAYQLWNNHLVPYLLISVLAVAGVVTLQIAAWSSRLFGKEHPHRSQDSLQEN